MVTVIDISTLYKERRGKALDMIAKYNSIKHPNLIKIFNWWYIPDQFIFVETEAPSMFYYSNDHWQKRDQTTNWKSFCKQKFEIYDFQSALADVANGIQALHDEGIIHRDVHPSRIHEYPVFVKHNYYEVVKFNMVGMPFNFKKLLKRDNFSGHVNYSAPELILDKMSFNTKVDIWGLGCCIYFMLAKKDPFDGRTPQETKNNILNQ